MHREFSEAYTFARRESMLSSSIQSSCPNYAKVTPPHSTGFEESIVRWRDRARRANEQKFIPGRTRSVRLASRYREVTAEVLFYFIPSMKIIHTYFFANSSFCFIIVL